MSRHGVTIWFGISLLMGGCATWDAPESHQDWKLPTVMASQDTVTYEMAFLRWSPGQAADSDFWQSADEQFLSVETRQELAANGLRLGVIADPMPASLLRALQATQNPVAVITDQDATAGSEVLTRRERRQISLGTPSDIDVVTPPTTGEVTESVVLYSEDGRVRAERFNRPRGYFRLKTRGLGSDGVEFQVIPTVDHGDEKPEIIAGQGIYRSGLRRSQRQYERLAFTTVLKPGRTLVITATEEPRGLGAAWFAGRFGSTEDRLVLLLHLADADRNELFAPSTTRESLVSPLE